MGYGQSGIPDIDVLSSQSGIHFYLSIVKGVNMYLGWICTDEKFLIIIYFLYCKKNCILICAIFPKCHLSTFYTTMSRFSRFMTSRYPYKDGIYGEISYPAFSGCAPLKEVNMQNKHFGNH